MFKLDFPVIVIDFVRRNVYFMKLEHIFRKVLLLLGECHHRGRDDERDGQGEERQNDNAENENHVIGEIFFPRDAEQIRIGHADPVHEKTDRLAVPPKNQRGEKIDKERADENGDGNLQEYDHVGKIARVGKILGKDRHQIAAHMLVQERFIAQIAILVIGMGTKRSFRIHDDIAILFNKQRDVLIGKG